MLGPDQRQAKGDVVMSYKPQAYTSAAPYLMIRDARAMLDFLHEVFGAEAGRPSLVMVNAVLENSRCLSHRNVRVAVLGGTERRRRERERCAADLCRQSCLSPFSSAALCSASPRPAPKRTRPA